jgi:2-iminobutanoate/2-iminopropanoate deaminase
MAKRCIFPGGVKPAFPYSPAVWVEHSQTLYISGQLGLKDDNKTLAPTVSEQTVLALERMRVLLKEVGLTFENVVSAEVLLTDMDNFAAMNAEYVKVCCCVTCV